MINIIDKNAFYLRITGKTKIGEYETTLDMNVIDSLIVNFVRRGRLSQVVSVDAQNRVLVYNNGTLAKGVYGVELVGYYNGQPWRHFASDVFAIVDSDGANPDSAISNIDVFDVTLYMKLSGDGVTVDFVQAMMEAHNADALAHTEIRREIPAKTSDLDNDAGFQTEKQVSSTVQAGLDSSKLNSVHIDVVENGGQISADGYVEDRQLNLIMRNFKGEKGDEGEKGDVGPEGPQGDSIIVGQGDLPLSNIVNSANDKAVTPKAVYDELMADRVWKETSVSSQNSVASDRRYISGNVWKSESTVNQGAIFPVDEGKTYLLTASDGNIVYAFVTAKSTANNDPVSFAGGATGVTSLADGGAVYLEAPEGAVFLYTSRKSSSTVILPTVKVMEMTRQHIEGLDEQIATSKEAIEEILPLFGLTEERTPELTWTSGYVSIDQVVVSSHIASHSNPVQLQEGECIIVKTRVNTSYMLLTEDTEQSTGAKYNVLVKGQAAPSDTSKLTTYAYIAPRAMKVVISRINSQTIQCTIRSKNIDMVSKAHEALYKQPARYNILAAFDNLVAIGDSITKGVVYEQSGTRLAKRPWPKVLQKICGFDILSIFAEGGQNAKYIWDNFNSRFDVPATGNTLCIIFLGTNGGFTNTLDEDAPEGTDPEEWNMTSQTGCMARIVKTFYDFGCNILLIKPWTGGTLADTHAVIDGLAERYGCATIKAGDIKSNNFKYHCFPTLNGENLLHFNELGYAHFASAIIDAVNEMTDENMKYLVPKP